MAKLHQFTGEINIITYFALKPQLNDFQIMKIYKIILIFVLACLYLAGFSQTVVAPQDSSTTINQTDAQGRKQGRWIKSDKRGVKKYEGQFKDDTPFGQFTYFFENGKIKAVSDIFDKGNSSSTITYYENGKKMAEGWYKNREKDSLWSYFNKWGELVSQEFYRDKIMNGEWKLFYKNGQVSEIITYIDDLKHGAWLQYYKDGTTKLEAHFDANELNGNAKFYFINGKLKTNGEYLDGLKNGKWEFYTSDSELQRIEIYENGSLLKEEVFIEVEDVEIGNE